MRNGKREIQYSKRDEYERHAEEDIKNKKRAVTGMWFRIRKDPRFGRPPGFGSTWDKNDENLP